MKNRGFTLIELLVVLAIIALLASIIFISISNVQAKSRDTRRMEDINSMVKALAIYQTGSNRYPVSVSTTTITGSDSVSTEISSSGAMTQVPHDPIHPEYTYRYLSNNIGTDYALYFCLEGDSIPGYTAGCNNSVTP